MRSLLFILLFTLPIALLAQKHKVAFSVSAGLSSQASSNYIENINNPLHTTTPNHPPKFLNPPVKEELTFTSGVSLSYEYLLKKNFSLFSGLAFSKSGFLITEKQLLFQSQYMPDRGYVLPALEPYGSVSYNFDYYQLSVPLGINYFIPYKKITFFVGAGVSANYLVTVNSTTTLHFKDDDLVQEQKNVDGYNKFNAAALLNFGAELPLKNNFSLRVFSNSQYTFTNIANKDRDYTINPYQAHLGISILKSL